jgi:2-polyprenyl-6-methoxyphenol hydroxylase-like FAD-dependent oxidoreductase
MKKKTFEADIIVTGGGPAGAIAAICAGRAGLKVILLERESYLGGTAISSIMGQLTGCGLNGETMFGGTVAELINHMLITGDARYYYFPMRTKKGNILLLRYNVESLKFLLEDFVISAGVKILYDSVVVDAKEEVTQCKLAVRGHHDSFDVVGKYIIDATGNATTAKMVGHDTTASQVDKKQAAAIIFKLGNVDSVKLDNFDAWSIMGDWYEKGYLPARFLQYAPSPNTNEVSMNVTKLAGVDQEDTESVSNAIITLRKQITELIPFLQKNVPGLENCFLSSSAPAIGIRDARRIIGQYTLTGQDIIEYKDFEDAVTPGSWPIDVHAPDGRLVWVEFDNLYKIPYASMVPHKGGRVLVTGKSIAADDDAFAAVRIIPVALGLGEAAGEAAILANKSGCMFHQLDSKELYQILKSKGIKV